MSDTTIQMMPPEPCGPSIRLLIQQGALPRYRVPVFRELASRPGIRLQVLYGQLPALANAAPDGFQATYVPLRGIRLLGHPWRWHAAHWMCASRGRADVAIFAWDVHYLSLLPALLRARRQGVGTILWGHGYSKGEFALRAWPRRALAELASALLFYNDSIARRYLEAGWPAQRLYVARNALDQGPIQAAREAWLADPARLEAFQRQHGIAAAPVILFVSRLDGQRRAELLVLAAAQLVRRHPLLRVVFIGDGPDRRNLSELAAREGIGQHVLFPGALYDEMQLAPWFLSSRVFCFPANIGLALLHAFGYGLPVVTAADTSSHGPEIEALRNGENGLLYEDGSVESLAGVLDRLLEDRRLAQRLGQEARRTAMEEYGLKRMVDGMEAAVRYCASNPRP